MLKNTDKKRYSYINHDSKNTEFFNKNFNKTCSYHTNFSYSQFKNVSFIGAKFKFSSFFSVVFDNCYLRGTLFKKCNLTNCIFKNCIVSTTNFQKCKVKNCSFENCKILNTKILSGMILSSNTEMLDAYPNNFRSELIQEINLLKRNKFIKESSVLHLKKDKVETVSLSVLVEIFGEDFLIQHLKDTKFINKNFSSLSYIINFLKKIQIHDNISPPGSATS